MKIELISTEKMQREIPDLTQEQLRILRKKAEKINVKLRVIK